jgi:hypothetical protein
VSPLLRICNGCSGLVPEVEHRRQRGRCADCLRIYEREKTQRRRQQLPTRIRDTAAWKTAREAARARDGGCVYRHQGECDGRVSVHHRVPLERGGAPFDLANLISVCRRHHEQAERQAA